jgi:enterochelin esterase-like enzyme
MYCSKRIQFFRPDICEHSVSKVISGHRFLLSIGWVYRASQARSKQKLPPHNVDAYPNVKASQIRGHMRHLDFSASLEEMRDYLVHLPNSYGHSPNQRYPVIYVLDGSSQNVHTAASAALMARIGVTKEFIVVGIPKVDGNGRQR